MASKYSALEKFVMNALRRASLKWPPRTAVKVKARVQYGKYKCAECEGLFGPREIAVDHKNPVILPEQGFIDWNTYIPRMFAPVEQLQVLCKGCHKVKTRAENVRRRNNTTKTTS